MWMLMRIEMCLDIFIDMCLDMRAVSVELQVHGYKTCGYTYLDNYVCRHAFGNVCKHVCRADGACAKTSV